MSLKINPAAIEQLKKKLANRLAIGCDAGAEAVKELVHVDTGRMQSSVRRDDPVIGDRVISCNILIGGTVESGVFQEQGIEKPVDYSLEEEIRHPQIRSNIVSVENAIVSRL